MARFFILALSISLFFGCQPLTNPEPDKPDNANKPEISVQEQAAFDAAMKESIEDCRKYITQFANPELKQKVIDHYFVLIQKGTSDDCLDFVKLLPQSTHTADVKKMYAEKKHQEDFERIEIQKPKDDLEYLTAVVELCKNFIAEYPDSKHKTVVLYKYFEFMKFGPASIAIDFLKQYPNDKRAEEIKTMIKTKLEDEIYKKLEKHEITLEQCKYYLVEYPEGKYRKEIADEVYKIAEGASLEACDAFLELLPNDPRVEDVKKLKIEIARRETQVIFDKFMQSKTLKWNLTLAGGEYTIIKGSYQILNPIIISDSAKLIIEPGTTLSFANNTGIICFGVMICEGLPDARINFIAQKENAWRNISFVGKNSSESSMKYTNISGGKGVSTKNASIASNFSLENEYMLGGSVLCVSEASPKFESCDFSQNSMTEKSTILGGGICCWGKSSPTFEKCIFTSNSATWGGGAYIYDKSEPTFYECIFSENKADSFGAGLCISGSNPKFNICEISKNTCISTKDLIGGGGVYCTESNAEFEKCLITENKANSGAGVYLAKKSSPKFIDTKISQNTATLRGAGVLCTDTNEPQFNKCIISNNQAGSKEFGGGIDCVDKNSNPNAKEELGNTVKDNLPRNFYFE